MDTENDGILVAGDVHIGSARADVAAFDAFLDEIFAGDRRPDRLVLLGDVWDLIRRDTFGCAWGSSETITRLKRLAGDFPVHVVFGNHDAHLRHLDPTRYRVRFHDEYVIESGDVSIRFRHGRMFDRWQFDALSNYLSGPRDRGDIDPTRGAKDPIVARGRALVQVGKRGLLRGLAPHSGTHVGEATVYPRRERRAHAYLETIPEDKLVYGHTHVPYVRPDNAVANPGSWTVTAPVHNTYLVVNDGDIRLFRYVPSGTDEELAPARDGDGGASTTPSEDGIGASDDR